MALGGQAGLGDPLAVDRKQSSVEIRGSSFLRNADSESKISQSKFFRRDLAWCAGLEIVDNIHKSDSNFVEMFWAR